MVFFKLINSGLFGWMLESIRNRINLEFIKNCENDKFIKQQSKRTFNGIHKSYTVYSSYTFKQNEVVMNEPIYVGFAILQLSKLHLSQA